MTVTMADALGRMQGIQSVLAQLNGTATTTAASAVSAASAAASATAGAGSQPDFSALLNTAIGTAGAGTGVQGGDGVSGPDVTTAAMKYLGVPYVFGGEDASGMDCSGLVQRVYADLGIEVPRLVSGQMGVGTEVPSLAEAQPGDLIVTDNADHIVIYAGDNKVIHAPYEGRTVSLQERWFDESDIVTIRRIVPAESAGTAAGTAALAVQALAGTTTAQGETRALNESMLAAARSIMLGGVS